MPVTECGFQSLYGESGSDALAIIGPTLQVYVGFDPNFEEKPANQPDFPSVIRPALVDTGASDSCIGATMAHDLGLPVVDRQTIAGVGGPMEVDVFWAQMYVPELEIGFTGPVAGVHLGPEWQSHSILIGRDFLRHFTMVYEGKTGSVKISSTSGRKSWRTWWSKLLGQG